MTEQKFLHNICSKCKKYKWNKGYRIFVPVRTFIMTLFMIMFLEELLLGRKNNYMFTLHGIWTYILKFICTPIIRWENMYKCQMLKQVAGKKTGKSKSGLDFPEQTTDSSWIFSKIFMNWSFWKSYKSVLFSKKSKSRLKAQEPPLVNNYMQWTAQHFLLMACSQWDLNPHTFQYSPYQMRT